MVDYDAPGRTRRPVMVVVAEPHDVVRAGLATILGVERDIVLLGEAGSRQAALDLCARTQPDVLVVGAYLVAADPPGFARRLRERSAGTRLLLFAAEATVPPATEEAREAAANVPLKANRQALVAAVRALARGEAPAHGARRAPAVPSTAGAATDTAKLTPRQLEVLRLVARGQSNQEVARGLGISPGTAKVHVERLIARLGVSGRAEAVARGFELGLLDRPNPGGARGNQGPQSLP